MRPIDADAMYDEYLRKPSIYDTTDLPEMLGYMPTIDAIPVEWLEDKMLNSPKELSLAAWRVLNAWRPRNEQEAKK